MNNVNKKLSKEQKDFILKRLSHLFTNVQLLCDGHKIDLSMRRVSKMKLGIVLYIDGFFKGEWIYKPEEHRQSKFFPDRYKSVFNPTVKKKLTKLYGVKKVYKEYPDLDKKVHYKDPYFNTAKSAIDHLIKVSESIELLTEM